MKKELTTLLIELPLGSFPTGYNPRCKVIVEGFPEGKNVMKEFDASEFTSIRFPNSKDWKSQTPSERELHYHKVLIEAYETLLILQQGVTSHYNLGGAPFGYSNEPGAKLDRRVAAQVYGLGFKGEGSISTGTPSLKEIADLLKRSK